MKLFKRLAVVLTAIIAVVCVAAFAACNKDDEGGNGGNNYATTTVEVTVKDENGDLIDGTTFGEGDYDPELKQVNVQFCIPDGICFINENLGADGKVVIDYNEIKTKATSSGDTNPTIELHINGVAKKGYKVAYGQYKLNEVPAKIEVTLEKA